MTEGAERYPRLFGRHGVGLDGNSMGFVLGYAIEIGRH